VLGFLGNSIVQVEGVQQLSLGIVSWYAI